MGSTTGGVWNETPPAAGEDAEGNRKTRAAVAATAANQGSCRIENHLTGCEARTRGRSLFQMIAKPRSTSGGGFPCRGRSGLRDKRRDDLGELLAQLGVDEVVALEAGRRMPD